MPNGVTLKRKDIPLLESGKPFSPTMFEGVLKKFTPDVSTSISGRPRFALLYSSHLSSFLRKTKPYIYFIKWIQNPIYLFLLNYSQHLDCVLDMHWWKLKRQCDVLCFICTFYDILNSGFWWLTIWNGRRNIISDRASPIVF